SPLIASTFSALALLPFAFSLCFIPFGLARFDKHESHNIIVDKGGFSFASTVRISPREPVPILPLVFVCILVPFTVNRYSFLLPVITNCPTNGFSRDSSMDLSIPKNFLKCSNVSLCLSTVIRGGAVWRDD